MCAYLQTAAGYAKVCPRIEVRARGTAGRREPRRSTRRSTGPSRPRPRPPRARCPPPTPGPESATASTPRPSPSPPTTTSSLTPAHRRTTTDMTLATTRGRTPTITSILIIHPLTRPPRATITHSDLATNHALR